MENRTKQPARPKRREAKRMAQAAVFFPPWTGAFLARFCPQGESIAKTVNQALWPPACFC
jgi:hypothetical protein